MSIQQEMKNLLNRHGFKTTKSLGQNFLIDEEILSQIIEGSGVTKEDVAIEIGAGVGVLTKALAEKSGNVISIEIDKKLIPLLEEVLINNDNVTLVNEDILDVDLEELIEKLGFTGKPIKVVANLPYYITTPIILKLIKSNLPAKTMTLMMQQEVAERLNAQPSTKAYGSLSIYVQYFTKTKIIAKAPPHAFRPMPKVSSTVLGLEMRDEKPVEVIDEEVFFKIVRGAFSKRRKTIANSLTGYEDLGDKEVINNLLKKSNIDPKRRGETLTIEEYANMANIYSNYFKK